MVRDDDDDDRPAWDSELAEAVVGELILVGITELTASGARIGQRQFHGHAVWADPRRGIALRLGGAQHGEEMVLPPDTRSFQRAKPGEYRLRQTGEVVRNPGFLTTWEVWQRDKSRDH